MTGILTGMSRRRFLGQSAAASCLAAAPLGNGTPLVAQEVAGTTVQIIDTGWGLSSDLIARLASAGVRVAFRYYSQEDNLPGKNITRRERGILADHGIGLAIVYQFKGQANGRYVAGTGQRDAAFCLGRAQEIGQPGGSTIYFGIDNDRHDIDGVRAYLAAVRDSFAGRYDIGVYGAGFHCQTILSDGLARYAWVPEAPAWRGTQDFVNSRNWTLMQNKTNVSNSVWVRGSGLPIDTNILNPTFSEFGAFDGAGAPLRFDPIDTQLIALSRRFVAAPEGTDIREEPSASAAIKTRMCVARTLHVLGVTDGYAMVDIDEDGVPDGYCREADLAPLHAMPRYRSGCKPPKI